MTTYTYSRFGATLVKQDTRRDINPALLLVEGETRRTHVPIIRAGSAVNAGSTTALSNGPLLLMLFTPNSSAVWQQFKIPATYIGNLAFHVHWSKSSDVGQQGKNVRWRVTYTIFNGYSQDALANQQVVEVEDTYEANDTTARVVYSTGDVAITTGAIAEDYVALKVVAITPLGTALTANPGLFSLDLTYDEYINIG